MVLITWPDYDVDDPALGGALTAAGLELRLAPKLGHRCGCAYRAGAIHLEADEADEL